STASDNQPSVEINVLQGERPMAQDNISLGRFHLDGIPPAPRGMPQIEVKFSIDANGIVSVTAKDLGTKREQSITITGQSKLSEDEIQKKIKDAELHAEEDKVVREKIEARNELSGMVFQAEKLMKDNADKVEDLKDDLIKAIDEAKELEKSEDLNKIKEAKDKLEKLLHKLAEKIYAQGGAPGGAPGGMGGMSPEQAAAYAQQAAQAGKGGAGFGNMGGATYDSPDEGKKKKKKVVDVDWEDE
ncbi:MAG: Hsp70 family protein, partial [Promethearchaeota archaeon]